MAYTTPWPRVYPDLATLPASEVKRITIELPVTDANAIMSVCVNHAIFSLICQTALKSTADTIRANNLTYGDATALVNAIRQRTFGCPVETPPASDVAGRTQGLHDRVTNPPEVPAGAGKKVTRRGGGKK